MKSDQYKKVYEGKAVEVNLIRTILEDNGISAIVKDDMMSQVFPLYVASGELKPVKIYIDHSSFDEGSKLVKIYTKQIDQNERNGEK